MQTIQKETTADGKLAVKEKPPLPQWRLTNRTDLLLQSALIGDSNEVAKNARASTASTLKYLGEKAEKARQDGNAAEADKLQKQHDFVADLFDYVERLYNALSRLNAQLNVEKNNLQVALDQKLKEPAYVDTIKRMARGAVTISVGVLVVGTGLWAWFTGKIENLLPTVNKTDMQQILNGFGSILQLGVLIGIDSFYKLRKSIMNKKFTAKNNSIDAILSDVKNQCIKLAEIEYFRLAFSNDLEVTKIVENGKHLKAHEIVNGVMKKYNYALPLPDSLLDANGFAKPKGRLKGFISKISEAFHALGSHKATPENPAPQ